MRQDLSEEEFNTTRKTRSTYNSATSACQAGRLNFHNLVDQDRAHCHKAARKASKLGGTEESLCFLGGKPQVHSLGDKHRRHGPKEPLNITIQYQSTQVVH